MNLITIAYCLWALTYNHELVGAQCYTVSGELYLSLLVQESLRLPRTITINFIISDISIYLSGYPLSPLGNQQFQESNNQCLANYTVFSASIIDGSASKGITCSRKDSTGTGTWTHNGTMVDCSDTTEPVRCTRQQPGSVTLYTAGPYDSSGDDVAVPEGNYTCCIDGLCISIRLWQVAV